MGLSGGAPQIESPPEAPPAQAPKTDPGEIARQRADLRKKRRNTDSFRVNPSVNVAASSTGVNLI